MSIAIYSSLDKISKSSASLQFLHLYMKKRLRKHGMGRHFVSRYVISVL